MTRIVLLLLLVSPTVANASRASAKGFYNDGLNAFRDGQYSIAAKAFERAYENFPDTRLLYNIAQAYSRIPNLERARFYFNRFLQIAPARSPLRAAVAQRLKELDTPEPVAVERTEPDPRSDALNEQEPPTKVERKPMGKSWRVWTAVGVVVVVAAGVGLGLGFGLNQPGAPSSGNPVIALGTVP